MKYLQSLLRRSTNSKDLLRKFTGAVKAIEHEARQCYAGPIGTTSVEEFVKILVLDGCFIIELFRKDAEEVIKDPDDPIFSVSCLLEFLKHDLILLENQIPWPVLDRLFNMTMVPGGKSLIELALEFFSNIPTQHRFRMATFPLCTENQRLWNQIQGVAPDSILDIRFNNGSLEIPPLLVQQTTETIFRNLISLEQCLPNCLPIITSYVKLMDNLIDTTEDVEILCDNDVLDNWLNPGDATRFFNKLYSDAYVKTFYYHDVCHKVNSYSKRWWPKWRYFYTHNYFTTPWAIVSQIVALIFLILGFLQTYYSIVGYLGDKKNGT
ncbi:hypothetical protein Ddye_000073 [Dipteronia dyeriana]|uniref:Uncharacterized protein n=1 Tax=Dipteronia dyeriana TaxID=168575 RepID=A0AAD9XL55_9ROSI|nr:hypothetical protein Ddye_000073 [Dipteronia dyeriana]